MTARTTRRARLLGTGVAVVGLLVCGAATLLANRCSRTHSANELRAELEQRLPEGSTFEEAEAWFASRGIRASTVYSPIKGTHYAEKRGLKGAVPDNRCGNPGYIHIELSFVHGKLWDRVVERRTGTAEK